MPEAPRVIVPPPTPPVSTKVGSLLKTRTPVPVSSVMAVRRFELDGVASQVATPVPSPVMPLIGRPVALVRVRKLGVPRFGVTSVGELAKTSAPVPVSSPTIAAISEEVLMSAAERPPTKPRLEVATQLVPVKVERRTWPFVPASPEVSLKAPLSERSPTTVSLLCGVEVPIPTFPSMNAAE